MWNGRIAWKDAVSARLSGCAHRWMLRQQLWTQTVLPRGTARNRRAPNKCSVPVEQALR